MTATQVKYALEKDLKNGPNGLEKAQNEAQKLPENKAYRPGKPCGFGISLHKVTIGLKRLGICLIKAKGVPALSVPKKAKKVPHFFQRKKWGPGLGKALKQAQQ